LTTLPTVIAVSGVVFVAAVLQRAVGFGFALIAVPLMAFVVPTKSAVIVVILNGAVTSAWLAVRLRHRIDRRTTGLLGIGTIGGAPIGVVVLSAISAAALRLSLGIVTCLAAGWVVLMSRRGAPPVEASPARTVLVGVASGVLATSLATNGPPLVYELRRTGFRDDRFRATISAAFCVSNVIGIPLLVAAGLVTGQDVALAAAALPPCVAGIALGARLSTRMATSHFVWTVDLLLLATGAVTISRALA
jgi:uncharacterized membrane protein YfcA